jgi:hypothetical protein
VSAADQAKGSEEDDERSQHARSCPEWATGSTDGTGRSKSASPPSSFAMPKSSNRTRPALSTSMFEGFRSRCTIRVSSRAPPRAWTPQAPPLHRCAGSDGAQDAGAGASSEDEEFETTPAEHDVCWHGATWRQFVSPPPLLPDVHVSRLDDGVVIPEYPSDESHSESRRAIR